MQAVDNCLSNRLPCKLTSVRRPHHVGRAANNLMLPSCPQRKYSPFLILLCGSQDIILAIFPFLTLSKHIHVHVHTHMRTYARVLTDTCPYRNTQKLANRHTVIVEPAMPAILFCHVQTAVWCHSMQKAWAGAKMVKEGRACARAHTHAHHR